ncbi:MAG: T9SS type A sorting domain-containing protein [Bacteroidales bacterium]|nr:T9SS type A sorting domain-containing protein [Bacteroidales bacterium]
MRIVIISILISVNLNLFSQKGPSDFTAEDIYGHKHSLFKDYLDNGQFVFIDFFGTGCGPCQYITPSIDTVFQEFGCGYGKIAFLGIELSSDNATVRSFAENYSMNFPPISGIEGQGSSVFSDYGISYTPYHILISPDKQIIIDDLYINETYHLRDTLTAVGIAPQLCAGNDFIFYSLISENDSVVGEINYDTKTVYVNMPSNTDISNLTANFKNAVKSYIEINGTEQISGETVNNFSSGSLTYQITSEKGVTENWTVEVNLSTDIEFYSKNINIYPNPSKGKFTILNNIFSDNKENRITIIITDLSGKTILKTLIDNELINIDLSNQAKGIYFLNIENKYTKFTKKLVIY